MSTGYLNDYPEIAQVCLHVKKSGGIRIAPPKAIHKIPYKQALFTIYIFGSTISSSKLKV